MIKRLKRKYIFIVMVAVTLVLGIIITAINITSYTSLNSQLSDKLTLIVENEGKMPDFPLPEEPKDDKNDGEDSSDTENKDDNSGETTEGEGGEITEGEGGETTEGEDGETTEGEGGETTEGEDGETTEGEDGETTEGEDGETTEDEDGETTEGEGGETTEGEDGETTEGEGEDAAGNESEDKTEDDDKADEIEDIRQHMSPETPFETRYFTVKFNTDGTVLAVDTSKIAAIDDVKAEKYATDIFKENSYSGFFGSYKYKRGNTEKGEIIYVFLDATRELESVRSFLVSSLVISGLGIVLIFILILLLSDVVLKPIIESYEKQKRFITDAGHEMKTPLTVISANAEIIEMENGDNQWVTGIKNQVAKLASLTEKLVILSKMEEGVKIDMNEFSLSEALFDTCDQYKSIAMSNGISFEIDVSEGILMIGNEVEIRRCISLLLDNAFCYANENGWVKVLVKKYSGGVQMKISNSTSGVEKGSLDRWFDRFYRTDLSRNSDTGGSGIGLSVVKAIVHAHGGSVHACSEDGMKVEFTIDI